MSTDPIPNNCCPSCKTEYNFTGQGPGFTKVFGRDYRYRNQLNKVLKCDACGNIHSWQEVSEGVINGG